VFLRLQDVVNANVIAEHGLRVLVAAFNRRAGEAIAAKPMNDALGSASRMCLAKPSTRSLAAW